MSKRNLLLILLLCLALVMSACGGTDGKEVSNSPSSGSTVSSDSETTAPNSTLADDFTVALNGEPPNVDPHNNTRLASWAVQEEIFDKLVQKDENGNITPDVATKWEFVDDKTMRFYLRDDVQFHDGTQLTAEDVVFSIQRAIVSGGSKTFFIQFDADNTKVVDDFTVDVATKEPFAAMLNYLSSPRGAILSKAAVETMGDEAYGRSPVGSGPFELTSWNSGESITLTRNESYWGDKPSYKTLKFRFIGEDSNRAIELETGGIDAMYNVNVNDAARIDENKALKLISGPAYKFVYVSMNMSDDVMANDKLREALVTAVDIPSLVDVVYGDSASVADSYMSPNIFSYASMAAKQYDVEKAKALLAEAGYPDGLTVTLKMMDSNEYITIGEILQNMWTQIGVTTDIQIMEKASFLEDANSGKVQIGMAATTAATGDPDNAFMIWRSTAVNQIQANDPKIDEWLDKGAAEFDDIARAAIYKELQDYMWEKNYAIPVAFPNVVYATSDKVEGFQCNPGSTPDLAKVVVYE